MRILVAIVLVAFMAVSCSNENEKKVVYMVRHAEKDAFPKNDPPLTTDGVIRSVDLASWFKDISIDTVFSTDYVRMRETAKPLIEQQGLDLSIYQAMDFEGFANQLKNMKADTILVIGHSNTILEQIEALGFDRPQEKINEKEYDKIFELRLGSDEMFTHRYGSKYKE
ncbi:phosphoglycerate mutase [Marivirga tractuosa]|uniref:Phosphoglycerate mutase n=1 Tax=Marivirga tractuosa (strain ATCC 23168 / DSM 4126 / NBRC 15989 / NCIMB 1408 / VKM B-1430 / H-43) TaxID=643867 RepID=E4TS85_MARTH|nr:histidine phosphatase family protein [Marivirga tractuosa]ADR21825.1 Phosphoglycerate mutase [Marivirga tractuosa DSM 4126]BDD13717.1 phosphoglycerate mutase [Marivirga tractuosa]